MRWDLGYLTVARSKESKYPASKWQLLGSPHLSHHACLIQAKSHPVQGLSIPTSFQSTSGSTVYTHTHTPQPVPCECARPLKMFLVPSLEIFDRLKRNILLACTPNPHFVFIFFAISKDILISHKKVLDAFARLKVFLNLHCKQKQRADSTATLPKTPRLNSKLHTGNKTVLVIKSKLYSHTGNFCHLHET